jgi:hypothetical protein
MSHPAAGPDVAEPIEEAILALCSADGASRTICPTDAARAHAAARGEGEVGWRSHLSEVRRAAVSTSGTAAGRLARGNALKVMLSSR